MMVSCDGDAEWPTSAMAAGIQSVLTDEAAKAAFQGILDDPDLSPEASMSLFSNGVDVEWRVLARSGDDLALGLGEWTEDGPASGAVVLRLHREDGGWSTDGWGDCQLAPVVDAGSAWAEVNSFRKVSQRSLEVEVSEVECTSGRNPDKHLHEPTVVETAETVTLYWTTAAPAGANDCQGNPSTTRLVELDAPLGSRVVLDGSRYPPRPVESGR